jgi:hypothetical protein
MPTNPQQSFVSLREEVRVAHEQFRKHHDQATSLFNIVANGYEVAQMMVDNEDMPQYIRRMATRAMNDLGCLTFYLGSEMVKGETK